MLVRRRLTVNRFDADRGCWAVDTDRTAVDVDELTLSTVNVWNKDFFAEKRYRATADLLEMTMPDIMVFQEVTPTAQAVLLSRPWVRDSYRYAGVTGGRFRGYGMLLLARVPIIRVRSVRLPSRRRRSFLQADLAIRGRPLQICSVHLESGEDGAWLRAWQLRRVFRAASNDDTVILGDFNMRDGEDRRITAPYRDLWPALRPHEPGFTEDSWANPMLRDSKKKARQVRFDRALLKADRWTATHIEMFGTDPIAPALPRVYPSDHFGLRITLTAAE